MSGYVVKCGDLSNTKVGKNFENITLNWIREQYKDDIDLLIDQYRMMISKQGLEFEYRIDFKVVLKSGEIIFIESKSRGNHNGCKGLAKEESTDTALMKGRLIKVYAELNKINYKYVICTNGLPTEKNNNYLKLLMAVESGEVHGIHVLENDEKTLTLEDILNG
jgi:hypothetical protein